MNSLPFNYFIFSALLNAATSLVLVPIIISNKSEIKSSKYFLLFLIAVIEWSFFYFLWLITSNPKIAEMFSRTCMLGVIMMPPIFFQFVNSLINEKNNKLWIVLNYIISGIFLCSAYTPLYLNGMKAIIGITLWPIPGILFSIAVLHFTIVYLITHLLMWNFIKANRGAKKEQLQYVFIGTFIGGLAGASNFISWYSIFPPILNPFTSVYIVFIAYAITKHELMDIRIAITRSAAYGAVGILLVASFMILNLFQMPMWFAMTTNALLAIFWAWGAHRLRAFIQTPIEEKWITGWYNSDNLINNIAQSLVPVMEKEKIFEVIADILKNTIKIKKNKIIHADEYAFDEVIISDATSFDKLPQEMTYNDC